MNNGQSILPPDSASLLQKQYLIVISWISNYWLNTRLQQKCVKL
jgi:hypothetical protein